MMMTTTKLRHTHSLLLSNTTALTMCIDDATTCVLEPNNTVVVWRDTIDHPSSSISAESRADCVSGHAEVCGYSAEVFVMAMAMAMVMVMVMAHFVLNVWFSS